MSKGDHAAVQPIVNHGWRVTLAGVGINLALGILYTWSVIAKGIPDDWKWNQTEKSLPYSVACLVFCLVMVPGGWWQDRFGPRIVATAGGILVGLGMIVASFTTTPLGYVLGFGLLAGAGIGLGYASATPPAVKWFPARKTGMIAGLVVSGFGLASVYAAPLSNWLIAQFGISTAVMTLGIAFTVVVVGLAQLLKVPPKGYVPAGSPPPSATGSPKKDDYRPTEVLRSWQFYVLWFMYACGAGAGLMIISKLAAIAELQAGLGKVGFAFVAALAVGNGAGRIIAGTLSDKIGRQATMFICFVCQAVMIVLISQATPGSSLASIAVFAVISALIGANYGANLSLFPSIAKDYYGLKNFGMNYGLLFTAWGIGGFMLSILAGKVYDQTHSFNFAYYCSAGLLVAAALVTFTVRRPQHCESKTAA